MFLAATLIFPLFIIEIEVSSIKGILDPVGVPKQIGRTASNLPTVAENNTIIGPNGAY